MEFSISRINSDVSIDTELADTNCQLTNKNSKVSKVNKDIQAIKHSTPYDRNRDELREGVHNKNESMQTSLVHYCSKSIQTDFDNDKSHINKSQQTETLKRTPTDSSSNSASTSKSSFEYIPGSNFSSKCSVKSTKSTIAIPDSSKTSLRSKLKNSSISSFEILEIKSPESETNVSSKSQSNSSIRDSKSIEDEVIIFNLNSAKNSSKSSSTTRSSDGSNSSPLGKMISTQQSKVLVDDIDQSLHLLQQFIQSDHYNAETKKYYAKKVVSKLIQFKYSGDSSSDSFSVASTQNLNKSQIDSVKSDKIISPKYKKEKLQKDELKSENCKTKYKKMKHQLIAENQSGNSESTSVKSDKTDKEKLDTRKQCDCVNNDKLSPKYKSEIKSHLQEISNKLREFKLQNSSGESCSSSNKNWRDNKTVSEKLLEAKLKSNESSRPSSKFVEQISVEIQTDSKFAQRVHDEKTRQLSWIKKEINYLIRLQGLLENNDLPSENSSIKSINEHFDSRRSQLENCIHHLSSQSIKSDHNQTDSQNSTKNSSSLEKLSKILTNDQLKFYINNIALNHRDSCDCCDIFFVKQTPNDQTVDSSRRFSYNSHNYTVDNIARSCQGSKKKSPRETEFQPIGKIDAETQCTSRSSTKTSSSETVTDNTKNTTLIFENITVNSESTVLSESSNKENCMCKQRRKRNPYTETKCECHPNPYFLTFEEGSTIDLCQCAPKRKPLETVTVKVPKFGNKVKRRANSYTSLTLEEYLKENRPDFVAAAEWRRQFVSERGYERPKLLFTSREMKQITLKSYKRLPEVQNKIKDCREQNQRRHNRTMANVFSKVI